MKQEDKMTESIPEEIVRIYNENCLKAKNEKQTIRERVYTLAQNGRQQSTAKLQVEIINVMQNFEQEIRQKCADIVSNHGGKVLNKDVRKEICRKIMGDK